MGASNSTAPEGAELVPVDGKLKVSIESLVKLKTDASIDSHEEFFDRREEILQLLNIVGSEPSRVTLLIGPVDSGKSKLLSHLQQVWASNGEIRHVLAPILLINMRERECLTPDSLANAITDQVNLWHNTARALLTACEAAGNIAGVPIRQISEAIKGFMTSISNAKSDLGAVQDSIREYVRNCSGVKPLIIIDEANMLKDWSKDYSVQLHSLMQFFIFLTKEKSKAHIILASSDEFFRTWIKRNIEGSKLQVFGLGYFSKLEAKEFVTKHLLPRKFEGKDIPDGFEDQWESVYDVAGGSPYLLGNLVQDAIDMGSWEDATALCLEMKVDELKTYLMENPGAKGILGTIARSSSGFVPYSEFLKNSKPDTDVNASIKELVNANIVSVRLWLKSTRYKDIPAEVKVLTDQEYVTAVNPAGLAAMKSLFTV